MSKYRIEYDVETKHCLSTIKFFDNAKAVKEEIKTIPENVWYVVEYAKTEQKIVERTQDGNIKYTDGIVCPKELQNL